MRVQEGAQGEDDLGLNPTRKRGNWKGEKVGHQRTEDDDPLLRGTEEGTVRAGSLKVG